MFCDLLVRIFHWMFRPGSFSHWIEIAKIAGAALAFWIGLRQYRKNEAWKRLEFVAAEMKNFYEDRAVRVAMTLLDWRKKKLALYKFRDENDLAQVTVDYKIVASALGVSPELKYDKVQSAIRETFERFLEFLARFEGFLAAGVIEPGDLNPYLDYWMKLISGCDARSPEVTAEVLPSLWKFIDYYGYQDVRRLISRYHVVAFAEFKE
jgi:hypothetical protein